MEALNRICVEDWLVLRHGRLIGLPFTCQLRDIPHFMQFADMLFVQVITV